MFQQNDCNTRHTICHRRTGAQTRRQGAGLQAAKENGGRVRGRYVIDVRRQDAAPLFRRSVARYAGVRAADQDLQ